MLVYETMNLKYTGNVILLGRFKQRNHLGNLDIDRSKHVAKVNMVCCCGLNSFGLISL